MTRSLVLLVMVLLLSACVPQVQLSGRGCNAVFVSDREIVTAAHCISPYGEGVTSIRASHRTIRATPFEVDRGRDVARLTLSESVYAPYYATYREPTVGETGYVFGGCPLRALSLFRVIATERVVGHDDVARWEWAVRDGVVSCPGDSGSPILSDHELGVFYGNVSRYERLQMRVGTTLVLFDAGTSIYSGAGE